MVVVVFWVESSRLRRCTRCERTTSGSGRSTFRSGSDEDVGTGADPRVGIPPPDRGSVNSAVRMIRRYRQAGTGRGRGAVVRLHPTDRPRVDLAPRLPNESARSVHIHYWTRIHDEVCRTTNRSLRENFETFTRRASNRFPRNRLRIFFQVSNPQARSASGSPRLNAVRREGAAFWWRFLLRPQ